MHRIFVVLLVVVGALFASAGCSDDDSGGRDCTALCSEGQTGGCTAITGNCGNFCSALAAINGPASCTSQYNAYQSCLNMGATVCANSCDSHESALGTCVGSYCSLHMTDANCTTLLDSF